MASGQITVKWNLLNLATDECNDMMMNDIDTYNLRTPISCYCLSKNLCLPLLNVRYKKKKPQFIDRGNEP